MCLAIDYTRINILGSAEVNVLLWRIDIFCAEDPVSQYLPTISLTQNEQHINPYSLIKSLTVAYNERDINYLLVDHIIDRLLDCCHNHTVDSII